MQCFFCSQDTQDIEYKDIELLRRFVSNQGKIIDPRHTATCAKHQRMLARAVKRARIMGLLSFARR
ncbi:30S ribosomal protein S18 [Candidatus Wolfebacteria bacterium]|nr:30S ribosomal protein S18 [Candidatus Wolfebacteria bacterium]